MIRWTGQTHKKLITTVVLALLVVSLIGAVYALDLTGGAAATDNPYTNDGVAMSPELGFSGTAVNLTLAQAIDLAKEDGTAIATAKSNKVANEGKIAGYESALDTAESGTSSLAIKVAAIIRNFAEDQIDRNYDAEMNALDKAVVKKYFETVQAREAVQLSSENASAQEKVFTNANLKFQQGTLSQQDLLKAEQASCQTKADLQTAQYAYTMALMAFNQYLGFPIMQNTLLTEKLTVGEQTVTPLGEAIAHAKSQRNEIIAADFYQDYYGHNKDYMEEKYGDDSSYYFAVEALWMNANRSAQDTPELMEMDVRGKYMQVVATKSALDSSLLNVSKASEALQIANLSLDQGLITPVDAQLAQAGVYQARLLYSKSELAYRLALLDYEQAMTIGTTSILF